MRCDQWQGRIGLLLDGELPGNERDAVTAHMGDCPDCARYRDELLRLRSELRSIREEAPLALLDRVQASLAVEASESGNGIIHAPARTSWAARFTETIRHYLGSYGREATALLAACALAVACTLWWVDRSATRDMLAHDVLAAHMRSLLQDNEVQVASLDTHTVKPWFAGRLDYTPVVKDLAAEGFKLIGGRLDFVDGRRVAALVYMRRLHRISVFIWPAGKGPDLTTEAHFDGYNVLSWSKGGMVFWAVSDLDGVELSQLPELM